jgi:hypothetical protein
MTAATTPKEKETPMNNLQSELNKIMATLRNDLRAACGGRFNEEHAGIEDALLNTESKVNALIEAHSKKMAAILEIAHNA